VPWLLSFGYNKTLNYLSILIVKYPYSAGVSGEIFVKDKNSVFFFNPFGGFTPGI